MTLATLSACMGITGFGVIYPLFGAQRGPSTNVVLRAGDAQKLAQAKREVEEMLQRVRRVHSKSA